MALVVGIAAAGGVLGAATTPARPERSRPGNPTPSVILYGDSILSQATNRLSPALERDGWSVTMRTFPGVALCSLMPSFEEDARLRPTLVVLAINGNIGLGEPCTAGRGDQASVYAVDVVRAAEFWHERDVGVLWVDVPAAGPTGDHPLAALLAATAERFEQQFARATDALRDQDGSWPVRLPCLESERRDGLCDPDGAIAVRYAETDGHPCPVRYDVWGPCPVYSSGAVRWSRAVADAVRPHLADTNPERAAPELTHGRRSTNEGEM